VIGWAIFPVVTSMLTLAIGCPRGSAMTERQRAEEEVAIYATLLAAADAGPRQVIDDTARSSGFPMLREEMALLKLEELRRDGKKFVGERFGEIVHESTIDDYYDRTAADSPLRTSATLPRDWLTLHTATIHTREESLAFGRDHADSNGIISFSRAGFSRDGTQALVSMARPGMTWGGGGGEMYFMEKKDGRWTVTNSTGTFVEDMDGRH
jgi:hypothetical protein